MLVKHSIMINGISEIVVTKIDVLDKSDKIKICVGYKYNGKIYKNFSSDIEMLEGCEPVYEEVNGWMKDTTSVTSFIKLPANAKSYLKRIQKILNTKIILISVGSDRKQTIIVE